MNTHVFAAATRGTDMEGAVPADTRIIFAIGGSVIGRVADPDSDSDPSFDLDFQLDLC